MAGVKVLARRVAADEAIAVERGFFRIGAISIVVGTLIGLIAASFHGGSHPSDLEAALPEYAANKYWELVHLSQFLGELLVLFGLAALCRSMRETGSANFARLGMIVAIVAQAIYACNQAVDGVAIKFLAQAWVNAPLAEKAGALRLADAVRHIEIGTSSLWVLNQAIALMLFSVAILLGRSYPKPLGWVGIVIGAGLIAGAFDLAINGFAFAGMLGFVGMAASSLSGLWILVIGFYLWRNSALFATGW
jgi:hypothetical protein